MKKYTYGFVFLLISGLASCLFLSGCDKPNEEETTHPVQTTIETEMDVQTTEETILETEAAEETAPSDVISTDLENVETVPYDYSLTNRTSAALMCMYGDVLYYGNVYDEQKLYAYNTSTGEKALLSDSVCKVQFLSVVDDCLWFSANPVDNREKTNVYSCNLDGTDMVVEVSIGKAPFVYGEYVYYHDASDSFESGLFRKHRESGEIEELLSAVYRCDTMTISFLEDTLYIHNLADILQYNLHTKKLVNLTEGKYKNGINKLQYAEGYLYYYTFGESTAIQRMNVNTGEEETVLTFNSGDFWYDNLLITKEYIIFTGRQVSPRKEGEPEESFVRGTFRYSFADGTVQKIFSKSLGPNCVVADDFIMAFYTQETKGANDIPIMDYDGNDISHQYPGLQQSN